MKIILKNRITGNYYANGAWNANWETAEEIERDSVEHIFIRHTWEYSHVMELEIGVG